MPYIFSVFLLFFGAFVASMFFPWSDGAPLFLAIGSFIFGVVVACKGYDD